MVERFLSSFVLVISVVLSCVLSPVSRALRVPRVVFDCGVSVGVMPAGIYCPQCVGAAMQAQQPAQPLAPQCVPVAPQGPSAPAVPPPAVALPAPAPAVAPPGVFVPIPPEFAIQVPNGRVIDARTHTVYIAPVQPPTPFVGKVDAATMKAWSEANDGRCWNLFHRGFCSRPNHPATRVISRRRGGATRVFLCIHGA